MARTQVPAELEAGAGAAHLDGGDKGWILAVPLCSRPPVSVPVMGCRSLLWQILRKENICWLRWSCGWSKSSKRIGGKEMFSLHQVVEEGQSFWTGGRLSEDKRCCPCDVSGISVT